MDSKNSTDIDWGAIVDLLASEYGWTIDYIKTLDLGQIVSIKQTIQKRYDKQNGRVSQDNETVSKNEDEFNITEFEKIGKKHVRADGVTEIII